MGNEYIGPPTIKVDLSILYNQPIRTQMKRPSRGHLFFSFFYCDQIRLITVWHYIGGGIEPVTSDFLAVRHVCKPLLPPYRKNPEGAVLTRTGLHTRGWLYQSVIALRKGLETSSVVFSVIMVIGCAHGVTFIHARYQLQGVITVINIMIVQYTPLIEELHSCASGKSPSQQRQLWSAAAHGFVEPDNRDSTGAVKGLSLWRDPAEVTADGRLGEAGSRRHILGTWSLFLRTGHALPGQTEHWLWLWRRAVRDAACSHQQQSTVVNV